MVVYQSRTSTGKQVGTLERRTRKEDARGVVSNVVVVILYGRRLG